ALAGAERAQDRGPRRGAYRIGPLQHPQAPGLLLGRHRRGIGRRQVAHRGRQHLQRLVGAARRHHAAHRGVSPPPDAHGLGGRTHLPGATYAGLGWSSTSPILASGEDILREKLARHVILIEKDSYELDGCRETPGTRVASEHEHGASVCVLAADPNGCLGSLSVGHVDRRSGDPGVLTPHPGPGMFPGRGPGRWLRRAGSHGRRSLTATATTTAAAQALRARAGMAPAARPSRPRAAIPASRGQDRARHTTSLKAAWPARNSAGPPRIIHAEAVLATAPGSARTFSSAAAQTMMPATITGWIRWYAER